MRGGCACNVFPWVLMHMHAHDSGWVCCCVVLQVDEVKGIMMQNVEQVLVRGERLDVLVDRTDDLRDQVRPWLQRVCSQ